MKSSIIQLVDKIVEKLQESTSDVPSEAGIRKWLSKQGYSKHDVEAAINEVKPQVGFWGEQGIHRHTRVFSPYESYLMTPEAQSALTRLELYGLIGTREREILLERMEQFEGEIDLGALEYVLSTQICSGFDVAHQQIMYQALDGKDDIFH